MGYLSMALYVLSTALSLVLISHYEKNISPAYIAFFSFTIAAIFFNLIYVRKLITTYKLFFKNYKDLLELNVLTAIIWIATLWGLKHVAPGVFVSIYMGFIPITIFLINFKNEKIKKTHEILFLLIVAIIMLLLIREENSMMSNTSNSWYLITAVVAGAFSAVYVNYSSGLHKRLNISTIQLLSVRFYLLIITTLVVALINHDGLDLSFFDSYKFFVVAFFSCLLPLFCLQYAISHLKSTTVSYLTNVTPVATYLLQCAIGYPFDPSLLIIICALTLLLLAKAWWSNKPLSE